MVFLNFYSGFELLTTIVTVKTKKHHQNYILRGSLEMFSFFVLFYLVFAMGFWWFLQCFFTVFSMGFGGFHGFTNGFGGQELETIVKTKKHHQNCILRDSLDFLFCFTWFLQWFLVVFAMVFGGFCNGFWCFFMVFGGFSWFLQWFGWWLVP